ncbi:hypothetical protein GQX73_g6795 [Xylaria multiplex]|uniref:Uncharacterized protein n=1 Tax=Xylaria multiplex TaxID=323545 RepID=A0A7C8IYP4_9PEZI|nr:hypothetical protein GQX73_g6795 [Xylaria multiplex]
MNYHLDHSKGGVETCTFGTVGVLRRRFDTHAIQVNDLRGQENEFDIHTHSFQLCRWKPSRSLLDSDGIKQNIYPEAEEFVKKITGATRVHCFSHLIRQGTMEANIEALRKLEGSRGKDNVSDNEGFGMAAPARYAHIDQSGQGAQTLLNENLPDEAENYRRRVGGHEEDLVPMEAIPPPKGTSSFYDSISRGNGFQTIEVRANPNHKWYYVSGMQPEEALIFKCYDSKNSSQSRCCHASFKHSETASEAPRESMEMRFFIFYENEPLAGF